MPSRKRTASTSANAANRAAKRGSGSNRPSAPPPAPARAPSPTESEDAASGSTYRVWLNELIPFELEKIVGRFSSYRRAKAFTKGYLLKEHDKDYYEEYTENEAGPNWGWFEVIARAPNGQKYTLYVEKEEELDRPAPPTVGGSRAAEQTQANSRRAEQAPAEQISAEQTPVKPWAVFRCVQDNHNYWHDYDEERGRYETYDEAKAAARQDLLNEWDANFFDSISESQAGSHDNFFEVYAVAPEGEQFWVYVTYDPPHTGEARDNVVYQVVERTQQFERTVGRALYKTLAAANASARAHVDNFQRVTVNVINEGSDDEEYMASISVPSKRITVTVMPRNILTFPICRLADGNSIARGEPVIEIVDSDNSD